MKKTYKSNGVWRVGEAGQTIQVASLPLASASELGNIYQYTGATENGLIHAHFYECVSDGQTPATYSWQALDVESDIEIETTISAQSVNTKAAGAKAVYDFVQAAIVTTINTAI